MYVEKIVAPILNASRYQQVKYLNYWLTHHNSYFSGPEALLDPNIFGLYECLNALKGSTGPQGPVCEGYSRAFKVLCDRLQIPCVLVDGYAADSLDSSPELHMWAYVQMDDNRWYGVDIT